MLAHFNQNWGKFSNKWQFKKKSKNVRFFLKKIPKKGEFLWIFFVRAQTICVVPCSREGALNVNEGTGICGAPGSGFWVSKVPFQGFNMGKSPCLWF